MFICTPNNKVFYISNMISFECWVVTKRYMTIYDAKIFIVFYSLVYDMRLIEFWWDDEKRKSFIITKIEQCILNILWTKHMRTQLTIRNNDYVKREKEVGGQEQLLESSHLDRTFLRKMFPKMFIHIKWQCTDEK